MSLEALLIGTEDHLKGNAQAAGWQDVEVGIQPPPGKPPPGCGQQYLAVYPTKWENLIRDSLEGFEEVYGLGVCVTFRFGYSPQDRTGRELVLARSGMLALARKVMYLVHGNYSLMALANANIPNTENKIGEPLAFVSGRVVEKGADWFGGEHAKARASTPASGYAVDLSFSGGKRLQPLPL